MKIIFLDNNIELLNKLEIIFKNKIEEGLVKIVCEKVEKVKFNFISNNIYYVSPSNSFLFFDGGYDNGLRKIFPYISNFREEMKKLNFMTYLGRPYLPIGSSICISTDKEETFLVASPTMFLPHDVSKTNNAYHAFFAALMVIKKNQKFYNKNMDDVVIIMPLMCCGYGKMLIEESSKQMYNALEDFLKFDKKDVLDYPKSTKISSFYIGPNVDNEQPDNFDNREIRNVNIDKNKILIKN